jgi:hypothetical protein
MDNIDPAEKSIKATITVLLVLMTLVALTILTVSAPLSRLMGESPYRLHAAFHGLFAGIFLVTSTIGFYQALRLWRGSSMYLADLEIGSVMNAVFCFFTIALGNWIYIPYRVSGGPRSYFLETTPEIHKIFFEFKEFTALFTLPLSVAAAFIICRYGGKLFSSRPLREMTALLLVLNFFYFVLAFGLGAAITKLKSV